MGQGQLEGWSQCYPECAHDGHGEAAPAALHRGTVCCGTPPGAGCAARRVGGDPSRCPEKGTARQGTGRARAAPLAHQLQAQPIPEQGSGGSVMPPPAGATGWEHRPCHSPGKDTTASLGFGPGWAGEHRSWCTAPAARCGDRVWLVPVTSGLPGPGLGLDPCCHPRTAADSGFIRLLAAGEAR